VEPKSDLPGYTVEGLGNWNDYNWFGSQGWKVKRVYLSDQPQKTDRWAPMDVRIALIDVSGEEWPRKSLYGTGVRVAVERGGSPRSPVSICFPLEYPFRLRMTSTATYGLAAKNPVVDMDKGENDYRWLMDKLPVDGLWSPELLKILRTYPGYAFHLLVEDPPNPPDIDRVRVCIDYEVLSATRIQFRLQNQQFGKYVFISLDGGKKYMDAGPWIQPVPEDPDAVILDLDRLPSEKHPKILDQNFKVLVAGTRMWSVHALIYAWGRGWEYPPDTGRLSVAYNPDCLHSPCHDPLPKSGWLYRICFP